MMDLPKLNMPPSCNQKLSSEIQSNMKSLCKVNLFLCIKESVKRKKVEQTNKTRK